MSTTARESVHDREGGAYPDEPQSADRTGGRLGRLHAPRRRDGPDPVPRRNGRGIYARPRPVALGQTSLADERLQFGPEEICARHLPRGTSLKLGVYTAKGKITAENLGQRLTVSCEVHPIAQCADHGCNVELYLNRDVMELETLGVLARLAPGQSTHHTEFWTLEPLPEG